MIRTLYLARANATLVDAEGNYIFNDNLFHSLVAGFFFLNASRCISPTVGRYSLFTFILASC